MRNKVVRTCYLNICKCIIESIYLHKKSRAGKIKKKKIKEIIIVECIQ